MDTNGIVKTMNIAENLNDTDIQYIICEGYKTHLIFTNAALDSEKFKYYTLINGIGNLVSVHTSAILTLNHLSVNKLPIYLHFDVKEESKFVRTFLKFCYTEFQYNTIKPRLSNIIKYAINCNKNN